jgi:hypothetical protein
MKGRKKRSLGGNELSEYMFQSGPVDYDELLQGLTNDEYPYAEKRFLGKYFILSSLLISFKFHSTNLIIQKTRY